MFLTFIFYLLKLTKIERDFFSDENLIFACGCSFGRCKLYKLDLRSTKFNYINYYEIIQNIANRFKRCAFYSIKIKEKSRLDYVILYFMLHFDMLVFFLTIF